MIPSKRQVPTFKNWKFHYHRQGCMLSADEMNKPILSTDLVSEGFTMQLHVCIQKMQQME